MTEIPKLDWGSDSLADSGRMNGFGENTRSKISAVSDQMMNGLNGKPDSFIVDLESFSNGGLDKDVTANSRINNIKSQQLQRSFSRKGPLQGGDQGSLLLSSSSPRAGAGPAESNSMPEKLATSSQLPMAVNVEPTDHPISQPNHQHHQTSIKAGNFIAATMAPKSRWGRRYNSFKRSPPPSWFYDPKRVLFFFATLSSVGTVLLIYFTLAMSKPYDNDSNPEW